MRSGRRSIDRTHGMIELNIYFEVAHYWAAFLYWGNRFEEEAVVKRSAPAAE
ncbi:hypothetical protein NSQ90_16135 [Paenibacillus sp. FSL H7-0737]